MFFAPPKVKSLSRYAEYGAYLGGRHFLLMLGIAITIHLTVIAIYSMMPGVEIVKIPVRVFNFRLASGSAGDMKAVAAPQPAEASPAQPAPEPTAAKAAQPTVAEREVEKALAKNHTREKQEQPEQHKKLQADKGAQPAKSDAKAVKSGGPEFAFATPKKYIREGGSKKAKAHNAKPGEGNGSAISGNAGGNEVIENYTQTISQWIKNHEREARERCMQAKDATGECDAKGKVSVRIRIDREGHILYNTVDATSGKELVDQLAIQIVRASDPLPAVPANYPSDSQLEFLIPVVLDLRAKN